jgi:hypothetical protein
MPKKLVFVSCGQETSEERTLGKQICASIDQSPRARSFYAQLVHSPGDLNAEVFSALSKCDAFLAVMHERGAVKYRDHPRIWRGSVWIQQEIAILCYRMFLQKRALPIRVYAQEGIFLEGVMKTAIVNPVPFKTPADVLSGVSAWLSGQEFAEDPITARRENLFRRRVAPLDEMAWFVLELTAAHMTSPRDAVNYSAVRDDFYSHYRSLDHADQQIGSNYDDVLAKLRSTHLITWEKERGVATFGIATQWWDLILDELRNQGRSV